jgi:hypothetical protein
LTVSGHSGHGDGIHDLAREAYRLVQSIATGQAVMGQPWEDALHAAETMGGCGRAPGLLDVVVPGSVNLF